MAQPPEQMPKLAGQRKILSPFQLAIQWENYDCLEVLTKYLDPCAFPTPLEACFLHRQHCPADLRDSVTQEAGELVSCPDSPASYLSPLGLLLADSLTPDCLDALDLTIPLLAQSTPCSACSQHPLQIHDKTRSTQ